MSVAVIIPFCSDEPLRLRARALVEAHLGYTVPSWGLLSGGEQPFSRGLEINRLAREADADVLLLHDADTLTRVEQMAAAVVMAREAPGLVYAYTAYCRLTRRATEALELTRPHGAFRGPFERVIENAPSHSCLALQRDCFDELGGYDQSYTGWGYEDCELTARSRRLWEPRRVPGMLVHLWHGERREDDSPLDTDPELTAANLDRFEGAVCAS